MARPWAPDCGPQGTGRREGNEGDGVFHRPGLRGTGPLGGRLFKG